MDKQQLIDAVNNIPKFRLREVAVKKDGYDEKSFTDEQWFKQEYHYAVTDVNNLKSLTYVSKGYNIVQFSDVMLPILNTMPDCEGEVLYDNGYAYLFIFPKGDQYKEGNDEFGLTVINSVNTTASVMIKFIVKHDGNKIVLPDKISGFKRNHRSRTTLSMAQDYLYMIDKVKDTWKRIIQRFGKEKLTQEVLEGLKLGKTINREILDIMEKKELNLWDAFMYALQHINSKDYKTELHRRKRLDKVCQTIIEYALILGI